MYLTSIVLVSYGFALFLTFKLVHEFFEDLYNDDDDEYLVKVFVKHQEIESEDEIFDIKEFVEDFGILMEKLDEPIRGANLYREFILKSLTNNNAEDYIIKDMLGPLNKYRLPRSDAAIVITCIGNALRELESYPISVQRHKFVFKELLSVWYEKCPKIFDDDELLESFENFIQITGEDDANTSFNVSLDLINFEFPCKKMEKKCPELEENVPEEE